MEEESKRLADVARASATIMLDTHHWLHRRVQRFRVMPNGLLETQISVDFTIPPGLEIFEDRSAAMDASYGIFWAPVLLLRKWPPIAGFDFVDPNGRSLPLLTSDKNREVDSNLLVGLAPEGALRDLVQDQLHRVATADKQLATAHVHELSASVQTFHTDVPAADYHRWRETLKLASRLAANSVVWARVVGRPGERMIVKLRIEDEHHRELVLSRRVLASLGWAPVRQTLTIPNADWGRSFHLKVDPPPGFEVHDSRIRLSHSTDEHREPAPSRRNRLRELRWALVNTLRWKLRPGLGIERGRVAVEHGTSPLQPDEIKPVAGSPWHGRARERAHLYVSGERGQHAVLEVDFAAGGRPGQRSAGVVIGVVLTSLLTVLVFQTSRAVDHEEATAVLLTALPALLGFGALRQSHDIGMTRHLVAARLMVILTVMLPFAAAAVLVASDDGAVSQIRLCWIGLAGASVVLTGGLGLTWLLPPVKTPFPRYSASD